MHERAARKASLPGGSRLSSESICTLCGASVPHKNEDMSRQELDHRPNSQFTIIATIHCGIDKLWIPVMTSSVSCTLCYDCIAKRRVEGGYLPDELQTLICCLASLDWNSGATVTLLTPAAAESASKTSQYLIQCPHPPLDS